MNFSSENVELWGLMVQMGIIAGILLLANLLRHKVPFIRKSLIPTAVLGGFLLLVIRLSGIIHIDINILEIITYHGIALGFIALACGCPTGASRGAAG